MGCMNSARMDERSGLLSEDNPGGRQQSYTFTRNVLTGVLALVVSLCVFLSLAGFSVGVHVGKAFSSQTPSEDGDTSGFVPSDSPFSKDLRLQWLLKNRLPSGLPLAYQVTPDDYFEALPDDKKPKGNKGKMGPPECGHQYASGEAWDKYELQTEKMLVSTGCVIYDAAVGSIALAVGGYHDAAGMFFWSVLEPGHTAGIMNIRGNAPCKGIDSHSCLLPQTRDVLECPTTRGGPPTPTPSPPLFTAMQVMRGVFYFTSSRTVSGVITCNTFLMPCCMQTTPPKGRNAVGSRSDSACCFSHQFSSSFIPAPF